MRQGMGDPDSVELKDNAYLLLAEKEYKMTLMILLTYLSLMSVPYSKVICTWWTRVTK
jgi:hypothetical protein